MNSNNKKIIRNLAIYLGIPILLFFILFFMFSRGDSDQQGLRYSDVIGYFEDGQVSAYKLNLGTGEMELKITNESNKESIVRYTVPNVNLFYNDVSDDIKAYNEAHPKTKWCRTSSVRQRRAGSSA